MNYKLIFSNLGTVLAIEAALMIPSLLVSVIYGQDDVYAFLISITILIIAGFLLHLLKPKDSQMYARDGFATVALSWFFVSLFGSLPFLISGAVTSPMDAFFESVSGFTTTGATILTEVESLPRGILFWRSFTHWVGGMGVLALMLAVLPSVKPNSVHMLVAESPGPNPGKLVPKIKQTVKILYMIYTAMTLVQVVLLIISGMPVYDSIVHALGTAGTGGFSIKNTSIGAYNNVFAEIIIAVFMLLYGTNFSLYYQAIKGNIRSFLRDAEFRFYFGTVLVSIILITIDLTGKVFGSFWESLRYSSFQVSSIISTTGYSTADFNLWPSFSKAILVLLMFIGASAGSTAGGMKCIRIVLLMKLVRREIHRIIHPRSVYTVKIGGKTVNDDVLSGVTVFFYTFILIFAVALLIVSVEGKDMVSNFTAVAACIGNIGPGLGIVGPMGNFSAYSAISKAVFSFCMFAGRLEIFPVLLLFAPAFWKKVNI
ncbi:MAG TPA: TrkH family potassium uptake protein [Clostridiales bacterium]|nr:TrkH family potassium uptake protein [Clostridiales bacterium]HPP35359.1 TrkH family potassium uptake protein [Clostridiales bacterium]